MHVQAFDETMDPGDARAVLEHMYAQLDGRFGHPSEDWEICEAMNISLEEFHRILAGIQDLNLGNFNRITSGNGVSGTEALIQYIPDSSRPENSYTLKESEIRERLASAIDQLPEMERLITSLHYYDELTLAEIANVLGIDGADIKKFHTKAVLRLRSKLHP